MPEKINYDPEKMLDVNKKLGEQSDYIKKTIDPLLTWEFAYIKECMDIGHYSGNEDYKQFWKTKNEENPGFIKEHILKNFTVGDLEDRLSGHGTDDEHLTLKLKAIGIEGKIYKNDFVEVFDDAYMQNYFGENWKNEVQKQSYTKKENIMSEKFNWDNAEKLRGINDEIEGDFLKTGFGTSEWEDDPSYFIVNSVDSSKSNNADIFFFRDKGYVFDLKPAFFIETDVGVDTAKKIVENTIECFTSIDDFRLKDIEEHINQQISDLHVETAKKAGYVQGVCESVLAFNNDENRKIMTEATMTFLSKKLLSEMNVTKDMAEKFANPNTYKALEQSVFAPKQEQQLEQTQSRRRGI